ncbi:hypothetical protein ROS1_27640 [Roseibium sp. ROS1]
MASGAIVDRLAAEFGVRFVPATVKPRGRHESRARRTCQKLLRVHGPEHLRQVLGMINSKKNRGSWQAPCITAVSWLILNREELTRRACFLDIFDDLDLEAILARAKQVNPAEPTATMRILLSDEMFRRIADKELKKVA